MHILLLDNYKGLNYYIKLLYQINCLIKNHSIIRSLFVLWVRNITLMDIKIIEVDK